VRWAGAGCTGGRPGWADRVLGHKAIRPVILEARAADEAGRPTGEDETQVARIEATTHIEAPRERVWEVVTDWEGQARWMVDARSVEVLGERREGPGVVLRCRTDIAGLVVTDDMETIEWREGEAIGMHHLGRLIRGVGTFELEPTRHGVQFTWWEELEVPFGDLGDAFAGVFVTPFVTRTFRRSLAALKRICESTAVRPVS
jgi:uncharacterized protein YndB with AHSA1/START domain